MNQTEAKKRIDKLIKQIDDLRYRYHVLNDPRVTDEVYDSLEQELVELEKKFPQLERSDSPLSRIGSQPLAQFKKIKHEVRQWSFNDAVDENELTEWQQRVKKILTKALGQKPKIEYVCELKIDGLHIVLAYQKGLLVTAAPRAAGGVGAQGSPTL